MNKKNQQNRRKRPGKKLYQILACMMAAAVIFSFAPIGNGGAGSLRAASVKQEETALVLAAASPEDQAANPVVPSEVQAADPSAAEETQTADPSAPEMQAADPSVPEMQAADPSVPEMQTADPSAADPQAADPSASDPQTADPSAGEVHLADPSAVETPTENPSETENQTAAPADVQASASPTPEVVVESSDYKTLSRLLSKENKEEYFSAMTVDADNGQVEKDGEKVNLAQEFDAGREEAKEAVKSEKAMASFLEEKDADTIYQVETEKNGDMEITAPYQTRRLIIETLVKKDTLGASRVYYNTKDKETYLEFGSDEQTKSAYEKAKRLYGKDHCFLDEIFCLNDIQPEEGTDTPITIPEPAAVISWGNKYMKTNYLKTQAPVFGYKKTVTVAVIDSGINKSHPKFAGGRVRKDGYNFTSGSSNVSDYIGHGSHVAGIIADATPANVKILPLKVTDVYGHGKLTDIRMAIKYAIKKKVQVINLSMGVTSKDASNKKDLDSVIRKAYYQGIPFCVSAGNGYLNVKYNYPANTVMPITVAAMNADGTRGHYINSSGKKVYYSNYGKTVDFAAPGTNVVSAGLGNYVYLDTGTSMAAPHIAAAMAYIKMMQPDISVASAEKQLISMSKDLGSKGKDNYFGWGVPLMDKLFVEGLKYTTTVKDVIGKTDITSLKNAKKGVRITWKKVKKADKYKICRRTASGKYKTIAAVTGGKNVYIDSKAKKGKKYYYKVVIVCGDANGYGSAEKAIIRRTTKAGTSKKTK